MDFAIHVSDESVTESLGASLGALLLGRGKPCFIALDGDMGAGKTVFVRGLASVLSPGSRVRSPTYTIVNEYRRGPIPLFHFDFCRLSDAENELYGIGFEEYLAEGVCAAEWSEMAEALLPDERVRVKIDKTSDTERTICISIPDGCGTLDFEGRG